MTLYLGNISYESTEAQIYDLLSDFGNIFDLNYPTDRETGRHRGFAFATLADPGDAAKAIKDLNGSKFGGRELRVTAAKAPERKESNELPVGFRRQGENPFGRPGQRRR